MTRNRRTNGSDNAHLTPDLEAFAISRQTGHLDHVTDLNFHLPHDDSGQVKKKKKEREIGQYV